MIIPVPSKQHRFKIKVGIRADFPCAIGVRCYDAYRPNSDYIRRRVPFGPELFRNGKKGYKEFTLPFPLSPDQLFVELFDKRDGDDSNLELVKFELEKLEPRDVWAEPVMHRFIDFAQRFAVKAGHTPTGMYDSDDGDFLIHFVPQITDVQGNTLVTPARTNRITGRIQASQEAFKKYTVPVRMVVLFHERYHFQLPSRLEKPCDLNGIRLYLDLGFPRTEAIYAVTKIFLAHPESVGANHAQRVKDVLQFIDEYSLKQNLPFHEA